MFRLIEPSSDHIQNTVPVRSVSAHIMGSHIVYKRNNCHKLQQRVINNSERGLA